MVATTTTTLLLLTTLANNNTASSGATTTARRHQQQVHLIRTSRGLLPQHKVKRPRRHVPYPADHPLSRHLNDNNSNNNVDEVYYRNENEDGYENENGSKSEQHDGLLMRYFSGIVPRSYYYSYFPLPRKKSNNVNNRRMKRRRQIIHSRRTMKEPESIQEGTFLLELAARDDDDENNNSSDAEEELQLQYYYYSITGSSLSTSAARRNINHVTSKQQLGGGSYDDDDDKEDYYYNDGGNNKPYKLFPPPHRVGRKARPWRKWTDGEYYYHHFDHHVNDDEKSSIPPLQIEGEGEEDEEEQTNNNNNNNDEEYEQAAQEEESTNYYYKPIRIRAILTSHPTSGAQYLTESQRTILMEDIINPALYAWSQALHVIPVGSGGGGSVGEEGIIGSGGEDGERTRRRRGANDEIIDVSIEKNNYANNEENNNNNNLIIDQSQLYDNQSCGPGIDSGLPSVIVPHEHFTTGLNDTDTVVYVSISFTEYNTTMTGRGGGSTDAEEERREEDDDDPSLHSLYHLHRGATGPKYTPTTRRRDGNDTDFETLDDDNDKNETLTEYPSSSPSVPPSASPIEFEPNMTTRRTCPGTYLASSTYCNTDQYDRPIAGLLSLCIPSHDVHSFFHDAEYVKRNVVLVKHELGHLLGFNAQSMSYLRDGDTGQPLTDRDESGDVPDATVECTGLSSLSGSTVSSNIPLPSSDILKFQNVRGGIRVATIVTPTVQRVARNMFNCKSLLGAELEVGSSSLLDIDVIGEEDGKQPLLRSNVDDDESLLMDLSPGECLGDHWSRRVFRTDLMNPIVDDVPYTLYISSLTLAYFADTGWYKVNPERIASPSLWGRNAGCNFVNKKCLTSNGQVTASNNPFFCNNFMEMVVNPVEDEKMMNNNKDKNTNNEMNTNKFKNNMEEEDNVAEIHGCSLDSTRKAVCSLVEYEKSSSTTTTPIIPNEYNYFKNDKYLDHTTYSYGGSDPTLDYCPVFEGYANGQCTDIQSQQLMEVTSNLEVFGEDNSRCVIGHVNKRRTALCLPIACVISTSSLMVKVDGYWKVCSYAGQIISVWWNFNDYVVCPDPSRMCPTFYCPGDCFKEGGVCDYDTGLCMCNKAKKPTNNLTFTPFYSYHQRIMEPCSSIIGEEEEEHNAQQHLVERIDFELPEYYVVNTTLLLDDPRDFDDKVSRMFAQLNSGEVVGLVASFMFCAITLYIIWSQLVKCYKRRLYLLTSLSKARSSVGSGMMRIASGSSLFGNDGNNNDENDNDMEMPYRNHRRGGNNNPQKDKMVATLLVQMRTQEEQRRRLELGGLATTTTPSDGTDEKKQPTIVNLSTPSTDTPPVLINRSDLPPLPDGGRVLAVMGAHIVENERNGGTSITSATQTVQSLDMSEFTSPLFQDDDEEERNYNGGRNNLRLRRHLE